MSLFNFSLSEGLTFFAVLVRFSIIFAVFPLFGDKMIPAPLKILISLVVSVAMFPVLVVSGEVNPRDANIWGATAGGIIGTLSLEVVFGLVLGYVAKLAFDGISFGANLAGNFMGFASASYYDPHQESQSEVVAQMQNSLAMLVFLSIDGHHSMLQATLESYKIVGLGKAAFGSVLSRHLISTSAEVIRYGLQIAGPVAISLFSMNLAFGVLSKAIPQLNIFVLSFAVSALIGLLVMYISLPAFQETTVVIFSRIREWMESAMFAMVDRR